MTNMNMMTLMTLTMMMMMMNNKEKPRSETYVELVKTHKEKLKPRRASQISGCPSTSHNMG